MGVGLFKRLLSYVIDIVPIIAITTLLLNLFVGDMIKNTLSENFDALEAEYYEDYAALEEATNPYYQQYIDGEITYEEYTVIAEPLQDAFAEEHTEAIQIVFLAYYTFVFIYVFLSVNTIYYIYMLYTKGNSLGRKFMQLELQGNVTWYTLLVREVFWKHFFWIFPLILLWIFNPIIVFLVLPLCLFTDIVMIVFTKNKKTFRDTFTKTYIAPQGVHYPF